MTPQRIFVNGVHLGMIEMLPAGTPRATLVMLHGFTGNAAGWGAHLEAFVAAGMRVIALDMLGHGASDAPADATRYAIERCREDIIAAMQALGIEAGDADLLGYSLGGRIALYTALSGYFRRLILESASPGIADPDERDNRRIADRALANRIEVEGMVPFVNYWQALPLFASQRALPDAVQSELRAQRLHNHPLGLANSLRGISSGVQPALHDQLARLTLPTLVIAGALDTKYTRIAREMVQGLPQAALHILPDAGHNVHLERPAIFDALVTQFCLENEEHIMAQSKSTKKTATEPEQLPAIPAWQSVKDYTDIIFEKAEGIGKITINRPEVRNAFRPETLNELIEAFALCREDPEIGVVVLTGAGDMAFCSGGDQRVRGHGGYVGKDGVPRLNALDLQKSIKYLPKPVIAMVAGYAVGGGHVLHLLCDLTIAADNARFGQTGPRVGSFDAGWGATYLARVVGHKKAREIWYLCRQYDAQEALDMGLVNTVVPLAQLEAETVQWCREILEKSPIALRFLKAAFNADTDGLAGIQELAGDATMLYYMTEEGQEGRNAYLEKRKPNFKKFPRLP